MPISCGPSPAAPERLTADFPAALAEGQFRVYYQPKFDIRPDFPVLAGAEALVRWRHPKLGVLEPDDFLPFFEENGLIRTLDRFVWRAAAAHMREWKQRMGLSLPVSVNVTRADLVEPELAGDLRDILADNGLGPGDLLLEISETVYDREPDRMAEAVERLRTEGFRIVLDDFGLGWAALTRLASLPMDILKLDRVFVRAAFNQRRDARLMEVILGLAEELGVPVIAEGVETEAQLDALKAMGCDLVQGFYFSRPTPVEEYERLVVSSREGTAGPGLGAVRSRTDGAVSLWEVGLERIAYALSSGFESVYYVDAENDHYVEFSSEGKYEDLQLERSGTDFFGDARKNIPRVVCPEDQTRVALSLEKTALTTHLASGQPFSMTYRLVIGGELCYYSLKAIRVSTGGDDHLVIGVSNVDEQVRQARSARHDRNEPDFHSLARALSSDMEKLYYVDADTGAYTEFTADDETAHLRRQIAGEDFFADLRRDVETVIFSEDRDRVFAAVERSGLAMVLESRRPQTLDYRLLIDGQPKYYRMRIFPAEEEDARRVVIGVSNMDEQIRREQELIRAGERVSRDPLTGVKSKYAYVQEETGLNADIAAGKAAPFALVVCDVNDLKRVNDTRGHAAGDEVIRSAAMTICYIFDHSPVYRYGGDEFVALLRGRDYADRLELMERLETANRERGQTGGAVVAGGLAEFDPAGDRSVAAVFARADAAMYENKKRWKRLS